MSEIPQALSLSLRVATAAAVIAVAGCSAGGGTSSSVEMPAGTTSPAPAPSPTGPGSADAYWKLPDGPCLPQPIGLTLTTAMEQASARRCVAAYKVGKIAVVDFSGDLAAAKQTASEAQAVLRQATEGVVRTGFVAVEASATAKKALDAEGCVDPDDDTKFASVLADEVMPALREDDLVVALSPVQPCETADSTDVGGIADAAFGKNRDADVYLPAPAQQIPQDQRQQVIVSDVIHESAGHDLLDFGHESSARSDLYNNESSIPQAPRAFDLQKYLKNLEVDEYSDSDDPMGAAGGATLTNLKFDPVHEGDLLEPYVTLGERTPLAIDATNGQAALTHAEAARSGRYISVKLPHVTFKREDNPTAPGGYEEDPHSYNSIDFVAEADDDSASIGIMDVYLGDSVDNSTLSLGSLGILDGESSVAWDMQFGPETIKVALSGGDLEVSSSGYGTKS